MKTRVLFMGTPEFACGILQALTELPFVELVGVVSQPDKKVGRQQKLQPTPVSRSGAAAGAAGAAARRRSVRSMRMCWR